MDTYENIERLEKFSNSSEIAEQAIKLLQMCIQVDTTNPPGNEITLARKLKEIFDKVDSSFLKTKLIETAPNRGNLIVDYQGTDPGNYPTWGFAAHLDVVPAPGDWDHPPISGDITETENDRFIWGRGAFDMKQIAVAHMVALLTLINEGSRPKGNLKLILRRMKSEEGIKGLNCS